MNKLTYTAFVAFWAILLTLVIADWLQPDAAGTGHDTQCDYTLEQVARHATLDDCWVAIEGYVYDLTQYIPAHPTPPSTIGKWCGREATEGMRTKGRGRDHSAQAWAQLERYGIGTLAN